MQMRKSISFFVIENKFRGGMNPGKNKSVQNLLAKAKNSRSDGTKKALMNSN